MPQDSLIPEGEYHAVVQAVRTLNRAGRYVLELDWRIVDKLPAATAVSPPPVKQHIPLLLGAGGGVELGIGRNVYLDLLRHALHQHHLGESWTPSFCVGKMARIAVRHVHVKHSDEVMLEVAGLFASDE
jgi:hypothetical protein